MDLIKLAKFFEEHRVELKSKIHIVELASNPIYDPSTYSCSDLHELLVQFNGGLKPDHIAYIGFDAEKARLVHDTYLKAATHARGIIKTI